MRQAKSSYKASPHCSSVLHQRAVDALNGYLDALDRLLDGESDADEVRNLEGRKENAEILISDLTEAMSTSKE